MTSNGSGPARSPTNSIPPCGATRSRIRSTASVIGARRASIDRAAKVAETARRSRTWSGASVYSICRPKTAATGRRPSSTASGSG